MSKYGVLLAGAMRTHQQSHADVFAAHPKCELVAVASEKGDPEGRAAQYQELADTWGCPTSPTWTRPWPEPTSTSSARRRRSSGAG